MSVMGIPFRSTATRGLCAALLLAVTASSVQASPFSLTGRIKQGTSVAYDRELGNAIGPSNFLAEMSLDYKPNRQFAIYIDAWLRGDLFPLLGDDVIARGIQDFRSPDFREMFGFDLTENADPLAGDVPFGRASESIRLYDDWNDIVRDVSVNYKTRNRSMYVKLGKFQHGWGQSDGLRLIDILNPQDFRQRFALADSQDIRIPQAGIGMGFDFARLGLDAPFEAIGLKRSSFEVVYYPQVLHSEFIVNNPTPSDQTAGGIFGFPFPELVDPVSGRGLPFIGANLNDIKHDEWDFERGELGLRFGFEAFDAVMTLNGFWGYQDLPVVTLQGLNLLVGTNYNDPAEQITSIPLDSAGSVLATWGPGGYMDQLRLLGTAGGLLGGLPIVGDVLNTLTPFGCTNLVIIEGCSVTFDFALDYDYRHKVVATSLTREIRELTIGRKQVSPVLRIEASYEFDKPFNNQVTDTGYLNQGVGSAALVTLPENAISFSDQVGIMAGFDFPLWIPFWDSQRNSIFTSFQFFDFYTRDHENKVYQAPYMFNRLEEHQQYVTALWISEHLNEMLVLEGLFVGDLSNDNFAYRQRIDFNFFGDKIRPRLEWLGFDATREDGALGFVHDADLVEFSLTYQF